MLDDGYDAQLSVCLPYIGEWLVACGFVCVYGYVGLFVGLIHC